MGQSISSTLLYRSKCCSMATEYQDGDETKAAITVPCRHMIGKGQRHVKYGCALLMHASYFVRGTGGSSKTQPKGMQLLTYYVVCSAPAASTETTGLCHSAVLSSYPAK